MDHAHFYFLSFSLSIFFLGPGSPLRPILFFFLSPSPGTPLYIALFREELLAEIYPFSQLRRLLHRARGRGRSHLCISQVRLGLLSAVRPFVDVWTFSAPTPTKLRQNSGEHCVNPVIVFQKNTQTSEIHIS